MHLDIIKHITEIKGGDVAAMKVSLYAFNCWEDDGCVVPGGTVEGSHVDGEPVQYSVLLGVVFVGLLLALRHLRFFMQAGYVFVCLCGIFHLFGSWAPGKGDVTRIFIYAACRIDKNSRIIITVEVIFC